MDGADDDSEDREDDDIDSDDALESDENTFSMPKFLAGSTTEQAEKLTRGVKVVDNTSSDVEHGTDPDGEVILDEAGTTTKMMPQ
ncbi:hypothetical protein HOY80DRAFT_1134050 [Tuber brumale]|nr:hypothetical protein HOY80DRAFT_1134050 [Tuber brumale]